MYEIIITIATAIFIGWVLWKSLKKQPIKFDYFEIPTMKEGPFICSDDECPCSGGINLEPGVTGYLYISKEVVARRKRARSWAEAKQLISLPGLNVFARPNTIIPVFMCEEGARRRHLNLEVAAADAKMMEESGICPLRSTPIKQ